VWGIVSSLTKGSLICGFSFEMWNEYWYVDDEIKMKYFECTFDFLKLVGERFRYDSGNVTPTLSSVAR
jgi:hypothetical protein